MKNLISKKNVFEDMDKQVPVIYLNDSSLMNRYYNTISLIEDDSRLCFDIKSNVSRFLSQKIRKILICDFDPTLQSIDEQTNSLCEKTKLSLQLLPKSKGFSGKELFNFRLMEENKRLCINMHSLTDQFLTKNRIEIITDEINNIRGSSHSYSMIYSLNYEISCKENEFLIVAEKRKVFSCVDPSDPNPTPKRTLNGRNTLNNNHKRDNDNDSLSTGSIVAIILIPVLLVILLVIIMACVCYNYRQKNVDKLQ